ncbi:MAG: protein kinase [Acidimicrobiales bacterium]
MTEQPGQRLGHYRLVRPVGTGGFATVWEAVDERLDGRVAVKILADNHAIDPDIRERFLTEAQLLRRLACEAVVAVYDVGETPDRQPFIVLEFADGGDLGSRYEARRSTGVTPTRADLHTVADALAAALGVAHARGLVHRDIKPGNLLIASPPGAGPGRPGTARVLFDQGEFVLVGDLGFGKDLLAKSGLTVGGGTEGFNAPEQRTRFTHIDARADIYGASAVLYWLATGTTPAARNDRSHIEQLVFNGVGDEAAAAIARGLAHDPDARYATIEGWHAAITTQPPSRSEPAGLIVADNVVFGPPPATLDWPFPDGPGPEPDPPATTRAPSGSATVIQQRSTGSRQQSASSGRRRRVARWLQLVAAVVAGGALGAGAVIATDFRPELGGGVTSLPDGRVQVQRSLGDLDATVTGPSRVVAGQPAVFEAATDGAVSYQWFRPDGGIDAGPTLTVVADGSGPAQVTLVASDQAGQTITVEFPFTIDSP